MTQQLATFSSELLIPAPEYFQGTDTKIRFLGDLNNGINTVNVLVINANTVEGIPEAVQKDKELLLSTIESTQSEKEKLQLQTQLAYVENLQNLLSASVYKKEPDDKLIDQVSRNMNKSILSKEVTYLSGIASYQEIKP